jgi:hypothetical protein
MKITIIKGDDKKLNLEFTKDDEILNITGYTVFFTVKSDTDLSDEDAEIKKDIVGHIDPINGKTTISITHEDTVDLKAGKYYFDIQIKDLSDKILSINMGEFYILQDVTERTE